jgi:hypothetical protein
MDEDYQQIGDFDRNAILTAAQYILSPDIPPKERKHFEKFYLMFSKIMALGNIKRQDVFSILLAFDEICMLLELGLYDDARQIMGRELMKMQVSRSVDGFQTLYGRGIEKREEVQRLLARKRKKSFLGRVRGGKSSKEEWEEIE